MYIPILYVTRMNQNKNDSINSYCSIVVFLTKTVVFPTSGFQHLTLCPRQYKWKVTTTYLAIRNKNS